MRHIVYTQADTYPVALLLKSTAFKASEILTHYVEPLEAHGVPRESLIACTIDYNDPNWEKTQLPSAPRCAGHAVYLRNRCKSPRDADLREFTRQVEPDRETIFSRPDEFVAHHGGDVSRVMGVIAGFDTGD